MIKKKQTYVDDMKNPSPGNFSKFVKRSFVWNYYGKEELKIVVLF